MFNSEEAIKEIMKKKRKKTCSCGSKTFRLITSEVFNSSAKKVVSKKLEKLACGKCWRTISRPSVAGMKTIGFNSSKDDWRIELTSELGCKRITFWYYSRYGKGDEISVSGIGGYAVHMTENQFFKMINTKKRGIREVVKYKMWRDNTFKEAYVPWEFVDVLKSNRKKIIKLLVSAKLGSNQNATN